MPPTGIVAHFRARGRVLFVLALFAGILRFAAPAPPARSTQAIAAMLGAAAGGSVLPDDFIWEERGGFFRDTFFGRNVLFLAAMPPDRPGAAVTHDVFRARVRLTRSGRPLGVEAVRNISRTPSGDEQDLIARGRYVAYSTVAYGVVQKITLLDRAGEPAESLASTPGEALRARVQNWFETLSTKGIGLVEVSFTLPPDTARFELTERALVMALGPTGAPAALSLDQGGLNPGPENPHGARARRIPHSGHGWIRVITSAVRQRYGEIAATRIRRAMLRLRHSMAAPPRPRPWPIQAPPPEPSMASGAPDWPPRPLAPPISPPLQGEGIWYPSEAGALPASSEGTATPDPAFYVTALRPDPQSPTSIVQLVAMDMRQVEIRMQVGFDAPRPAAGPRGSGRIPNAVASRVLAAFAGASQPGSGDFAMVVDGRIVVPPLSGAPTIATDRYGRSAFGPWPFDGEPEADFLSLRQARLLFALPSDAAKGTVGDPPERPEDRYPAERSAICLGPNGHTLYAWGADLTVVSLKKALAIARCEFALELATSPGAVGWSFLGIGPNAPAPRLLAPDMSLDPARFSSGFASDFFYVIRRDPHLSLPSVGEAAWQPDAGRQPPPSWMAALHTVTTTKLGVQVRLLSLAPNRFRFQLRAGRRELSHRFGGTYPKALTDDELSGVSVAMGIGTARRRGARGLAFGGSIGIPFHTDAAVAVLDANRVAITPSSREPSLSPTQDATELPLTADDGKELPEARIVGAFQARAALCALADGTVLVATTTFDTDEATTQSLLDAGCTRVVALDRGSHTPAILHRAGTETAPLARYDVTTLYAFEVPVRGRAYRFSAP